MTLALELGLLAIGFAALFPLARRVHDRLEGAGTARRFGAFLVVVLVALVPAAGLLATWSDRARERALQEVVGGIAPILGQIAQGAVGPLEGDEVGDSLLGLLRGAEVKRAPTVVYRPLDLGPAGAERRSSEGDLPFFPFDRRIQAGETLRFPVEPRASVRRVAVALPAGPAETRTTVEVVVVSGDGTRRTIVLDELAKLLHGWGEAESRVSIGLVAIEPPIADVSGIEVRARDASARIMGLSLESAGDPREPGSTRRMALMPVDRTRTGLPIRLAAGTTTSGIPLVHGAAPVDVVLDRAIECDRLWLVYAALDPRAADYRWFGEEILEVRLEYDDARPPEVHTIKHGEDVHSANLDRSRHAEDFASSVAVTWESDGVRWHADQRLWVFLGSRKLRRITMRNLSGESGYAVDLLGLTVGTSTPSTWKAASGGSLTVTPETLSVSPAARRPLESVRFAFADRRGVIRSAEGEESARLRGAAIDDSDLERILAGKDVAARCRSLAGIDADLALLPVRAGETVSGALVAFVPEKGRAARRARFAFLPIGAILLSLPYLFVAFARSLARGEKIRRKIAVALAVSSVVPIGAVLLTVPGAFGRARSETNARRVVAELGAIRERFVRQVESASTEASTFFQTLREHPRAEPLFSAPPRADLESALRREIRLARSRRYPTSRSFVRLELRLPGSSGSPWRIVEDGDPELRLTGVDVQGSGFYRIGDRLALIGVDRRVRTETRSRLVLGLDVSTTVDRDKAVRLFALDGVPLDGLAGPEGVEAADVARTIAVARRTNRPATWSGALDGFVDVFRDREGNPVFGFAVLEPSAAADVLVLGVPASLPTLLGTIAILGAISALAISRILTDQLTRPIERLAEAAESARKGHTPAPLVVENVDEVGVLVERFQAMSTDLVRRIDHLGEIQRGMLAFAARLDREEVAQEATRFAAVATGADRCFLLIPDPQSERWTLHRSGERARRIRLTPLLQRCATAHEWATLSDDGPEPFGFLDAADRRLFSGAVALTAGPLRAVGEEDGLLVLLFGKKPDEAQRRASKAAASAIAIALENSRAYGLAVEDRLTGALVPHLFDLRLGDAVERARALDRALWVVRCRLDSGDGSEARREIVLQLLARRLRRFLADQPNALVGRTGAFELSIAAEPPDPAGRDRLLRDVRKLFDRLLGADRTESRIVEARFPADAPSAELLLRRLRGSPSAEGGQVLDLEAFSGGSAPEDTTVRDMFRRAARLSRIDLPVLISGEVGAGKEWLARRIHHASSDDAAPFVVLRFALLPEHLIEAELFGVEKGAYSGATQSRPGLLELARGGTLYIEEIGEASREAQVKLVRVIEDRAVRRLGSSRQVPINFRWIASSSLDLVSAIRAGAFRADLYYRLGGALLYVPPLRDRPDDLPGLVDRFLRELAPKDTPRLTPRALDAVMRHRWPGNLDELRAALQRAIGSGMGGEIDEEDLDLPSPLSPIETPTAGTPVETTLPARSITSAPRSGAPGRRTRDFTGWNERQTRLLGLLRKGDRITTREYVRMMKVSGRTGLRDLDELVRSGCLKREGRKRGTSFRFL